MSPSAWSTCVAVFKGYAARFDSRDAARDLILPSAILADRPIPIYINHNPTVRVGHVRRLVQDTRGLLVMGCVDREINLCGLSIGYRALEYVITDEGRNLTLIDLFEVSLVNRPLHRDAKVEVWLS